MSKKKLLWIGDAAVPTGFARVTHSVLDHLKTEWDVSVLGVNYKGDPHSHDYHIYPASIGGSVLGVARLDKLLNKLEPDLVCIINDPWNAAQYLEHGKFKCPVAAYIPVDSPNLKDAAKLNKLSLAIAYTRFGRDELRNGGYTGPISVVPHGVDTSIYYPVEKAEARKFLNLHNVGVRDTTFIVGNVNRNQPRKRLDLTLYYFSEWIHKYGIDKQNVRLFLHASNKDIGWDLVQLANYLNIIDVLILPPENMSPWNGVQEDALKYIYSAFDVQVSTTLGEGWGLTQHEAAACGIPNLVPNWSALSEWPQGAFMLADCSAIEVHPGHTNTIGGVVDKEDFIEKLHLLYTNAELRKEYADKAYNRACSDDFNWSNIAEKFHKLFTATVNSFDKNAGYVPKFENHTTASRGLSLQSSKSTGARPS